MIPIAMMMMLLLDVVVYVGYQVCQCRREASKEVQLDVGKEKRSGSLNRKKEGSSRGEI